MNNNTIVRDFNNQKIVSKKSFLAQKWPIVFFVSLLLLGSAIGYFFADRKSKGASSNIHGEKIEKGQAIGSKDKNFKDSTEGVLEKGGIDGEGTHHLTRKGGPSQTVYLTSSVIDLDKLAGKKVKVWGETFQAEKAGWLMDVGRVELLE